MLDKLLGYARRQALLRPGDRVGAAVSGGADSVALLRLLLELRAQLGLVLSVVHFNHKIRGAEADADQQFVADLARTHGLEFHFDCGDTRGYARERHLSLEASARKLRYAFFVRLMQERTVTRVATAHTRDDQAETVLLRFLRGAGTRGLAGIYPQLSVPGQDFAANSARGRRPPAGDCSIVRPLLEHTHAELCAYLTAIRQPWREDATNRDLSLTRNRVRHQLLPLLKEGHNPALDEVLADTAEMARAEEQYWADQVSAALPKVLAHSAEKRATVLLDVLLAQPLALQRRLIRAAAEQAGARLEFRHVEQVLEITHEAATQAQKTVELPQQWEAVRSGRELSIQRRCQYIQAEGYDLPLPVPGTAEIPAVKRLIRATLLPGGAPQPERAAVLDAVAASGLRVRNWHPGDRYQPAHTAAPKKLKELLQARHIPRPLKGLWPVVVSAKKEEILWVPGFDPPEQLRPRDPKGPGLLLEEVLLGPEGGKGP